MMDNAKNKHQGTKVKMHVGKLFTIKELLFGLYNYYLKEVMQIMGLKGFVCASKVKERKQKESHEALTGIEECRGRYPTKEYIKG